MPDSNKIELRHLRYFKAVAEELHFRRASEKLFITQPGLSRQISQLERSLGVQLLLRDTRKVELTKPGAYLLGEVDYIINHLEQVYRNTALIENGDEGEIRIGFVGSAMHSVLPDLLKKMNTQFPKMLTTLDQLGNKEQIDAISNNRLDIGFIRSRQVPDGFEKIEIMKDHFAIVVPGDHSLDSSTFTSLSQLKEERFILFSRDYSYDYYELVMSIFDDHKFAPKVSHRSVNANTIFRLVENHMGVAIIPSSLQFGFDLDIRFLELDRLQQRSILSATWKSENRNPTLHKFLELLG